MKPALSPKATVRGGEYKGKEREAIMIFTLDAPKGCSIKRDCRLRKLTITAENKSEEGTLAVIAVIATNHLSTQEEEKLPVKGLGGLASVHNEPIRRPRKAKA
jgi:hypothetical protein